MKMPPREQCVKIRKGQVWRVRKDQSTKFQHLRDEGYSIFITGKAQSKRGISYFHTVRYDIRNRVTHGISERDIWRFFEYVGHVGHSTL